MSALPYLPLSFLSCCWFTWSVLFRRSTKVREPTAASVGGDGGLRPSWQNGPGPVLLAKTRDWSARWLCFCLFFFFFNFSRESQQQLFLTASVTHWLRRAGQRNAPATWCFRYRNHSVSDAKAFFSISKTFSMISKTINVSDFIAKFFRMRWPDFVPCSQAKLPGNCRDPQIDTQSASTPPPFTHHSTPHTWSIQGGGGGHEVHKSIQWMH